MSQLFFFLNDNLDIFCKVKIIHCFFTSCYDANGCMYWDVLWWISDQEAEDAFAEDDQVCGPDAGPCPHSLWLDDRLQVRPAPSLQ